MVAVTRMGRQTLGQMPELTLQREVMVLILVLTLERILDLMLEALLDLQ